MGDSIASAIGTRPSAAQSAKKVFFFDIDNCLYPRSTNVQDRMAKLIDDYFARHLALPYEDAVRLHKEYYTSYGLAIEGLVRHHQIDPLEYNAQVDDALPLEGIIKPNPELRQLLLDVDRSQVRLWLFTNAYINHGRRVARLLGIDDLFDGITYCDYGKVPLICKPQKEMFDKAMKDAGVDSVEDCFFVDDSQLNCKAAKELGWMSIHLVEDGLTPPKAPVSQHQIRHLQDLRTVFPELFKKTSS